MLFLINPCGCGKNNVYICLSKAMKWDSRLTFWHLNLQTSMSILSVSLLCMSKWFHIRDGDCLEKFPN